jgi:hypothetical protein
VTTFQHHAARIRRSDRLPYRTIRALLPTITAVVVTGLALIIISHV